LFEVASDFSVLVRRDGYYGVGTGASYAIGALSAMATPQEAMQIAIENDIYSGGAIQSVFQEKI
jgi:ATP-dependent protease HslVU (ClpYQ) peptidase subunit